MVPVDTGGKRKAAEINTSDDFTTHLYRRLSDRNLKAPKIQEFCKTLQIEYPAGKECADGQNPKNMATMCIAKMCWDFYTVGVVKPPSLS